MKPSLLTQVTVCTAALTAATVAPPRLASADSCKTAELVAAVRNGG